MDSSVVDAVFTRALARAVERGHSERVIDLLLDLWSDTRAALRDVALTDALERIARNS